MISMLIKSVSGLDIYILLDESSINILVLPNLSLFDINYSGIILILLFKRLIIEKTNNIC